MELQLGGLLEDSLSRARQYAISEMGKHTNGFLTLEYEIVERAFRTDGLAIEVTARVPGRSTAYAISYKTLIEFPAVDELIDWAWQHVIDRIMRSEYLRAEQVFLDAVITLFEERGIAVGGDW